MKKRLLQRILGPLALVWVCASAALTGVYMQQQRLHTLVKNTLQHHAFLHHHMQRMQDDHALFLYHMQELLTENTFVTDPSYHHTTPQPYRVSIAHHAQLLKTHLRTYTQEIDLHAEDIRPLVECLSHIEQSLQNTDTSVKTFENTLQTHNPDLLLSSFSDMAKNHRYVQQTLQKCQTTLDTLSFSKPHTTSSEHSTPFGVWALGCIWIALTATYVFVRRSLQPLRTLESHTSAPYEELVSLYAKINQAQQWPLLLQEKNKDIEKSNHLVRRLERDLAEIKLYHDNLVNSLRTAIVTTNPQGVVTSVNSTARHFFALEESHVLAKHPFFKAITQHTHSHTLDPSDFIGETSHRKMTGVVYEDTSHALILDVSVLPYKDESGTPRGLVWVSDDTTETVKTKNQLLHAERLAAVGRLSAQVAHEIRNPLSAIALNAELLEEDFAQLLNEPKKTEAVELLHAIANEIYRLSDITEGYLQLARMPSPNMQKTNLHTLLSDVFAMLNEELKTHHITYQFHLTPQPMVCLADPGHIRQALLNIVRNSKEALPQGGHLHIHTHNDPQEWRIELEDNGPGVPQDVLPRVFEPFYSTKPQGTGLGLSLTQHIMQEHQGFIELLPNKPHGTRAVLHFSKKDTLPTAP
jgi:signal transduction histidine kinase